MKGNRLLAAWRKSLRRSARPDGGGDGPGAAEGRQPTPIYVSVRVLAGIVALVVVVLALFLYAAPTVPVVALGGMALAIVLSFPVRALSHVMPRPLAILVTVLGLLGLITLGLFYLVPLLIQQLRDLVVQVPIIANQVNGLLLDLIDFLDERQLVPGSDPEEFGRSLVNDLFDRARNLTENLLRGLVGFIPRAFGFGVALFAVLFVGVYLLADPYAILLGAWVSATAIIPYLGAFIGGIPAVIVAAVFDDANPTVESTTTRVILVIVAYTLIQQFEGNFLTPRIQGNALHVHPILVLLAVIGGGELAGLAGVVFAVPAVAVLRVFFDFLRVRLKTNPE